MLFLPDLYFISRPAKRGSVRPLIVVGFYNAENMYEREDTIQLNAKKAMITVTTMDCVRLLCMGFLNSSTMHWEGSEGI